MYWFGNLQASRVGFVEKISFKHYHYSLTVLTQLCAVSPHFTIYKLLYEYLVSYLWGIYVLRHMMHI